MKYSLFTANDRIIYVNDRILSVNDRILSGKIVFFKPGPYTFSHDRIKTRLDLDLWLK